MNREAQAKRCIEEAIEVGRSVLGIKGKRGFRTCSLLDMDKPPA
jgi:hypothetical protein